LLRAAVNRATENYIRSKDGEAQYYLGVALRAQGKPDAARDAFYRAIWSQAWQAAGYGALAELACAKGDYREALELADQSLSVGALNPKVLELKTALLRKLGRPSEAAQWARHILTLDPLNQRARHEQRLILAAQGSRQKSRQASNEWIKAMRGEVSSYLELAMDYANCGLFDEAIQVLDTCVDRAPDKGRVSPLAYYYLAFFHDTLGQADKAQACWKLAAQMPADYCFPFQHEAEPILRRAMERNPGDARAPYYLGNLLFDNQPLKAIAAWEKAVQLDDRFALAQRNLGIARAQALKDTSGATACLEKAMALDPQNPRLHYELDVLYEAGGAPLQKRLENLTRHPEAVTQRDDATTRLINLLPAAGRHDQALALLRDRRFHNWEGSRDLHDVYVNACLYRGLSRFRAQQPAEALRDFEAALEYPSNQEVGKSRGEQRVAQIYYFIGLAQEALGAKDKSEAAFQKASSSGGRGPTEAQYFKALAQQKTGRSDEAAQAFDGLVKRGLADLEQTGETVDYFAKFGEKRAERLRLAEAHYLAGLGYLGLGRSDDAKAQFKQALELHPAHLGALTWGK
jgi:tetratricopeptide (TPR) repeat protein